MLYLVGSIVLTSWLTLSFKFVERFRLNNLQVIVINHIFCVITGSILIGRIPTYISNSEKPWFPWACIMGFLFIALFNLIGYSAQKIGVAVTSVANKLSLVIPFVFSIYMYREEASWLKIAGIGIALIAVWLTCLPAEKNGNKKKPAWIYLLPILLFFGSGVLDSMIKYVEQAFLNFENSDDFLITAFSAAALMGFVLLVIQLLRGKQRFSFRSVIAGAAIGIPNYFSIFCLLQVLKQYPDNSSAIIPINNMGIVLFSALMAWIFFQEKLSTVNWLGILLALGAIGLIAYG